MYVFCPCEAGDFLFSFSMHLSKMWKGIFVVGVLWVPAGSWGWSGCSEKEGPPRLRLSPKYEINAVVMLPGFLLLQQERPWGGLVHHWVHIKRHVSHIYCGAFWKWMFTPSRVFCHVDFTGGGGGRRWYLCPAITPFAPAQSLWSNSIPSSPPSTRFQCHPAEVSGGKMCTIPCLGGWWKLLKTPYRCLKPEYST